MSGSLEADMSQLTAVEVESVAERMRGEDAVEKGAAYLEAGRVYGAGWAQCMAFSRQLRGLARVTELFGDVPACLNAMNTEPNRGVPVCLAEAIVGREFSAAEAGPVWVGLLAHPRGMELISDPNYGRGFVEGALSVWGQVKDKL